MKRRAWKYAALIVSGGIVLQVGGCASYAISYIVEQAASTILGAILTQLIAAATSA